MTVQGTVDFKRRNDEYDKDILGWYNLNTGTDVYVAHQDNIDYTLIRNCCIGMTAFACTY